MYFVIFSKPVTVGTYVRRNRGVTDLGSGVIPEGTGGWIEVVINVEVVDRPSREINKRLSTWGSTPYLRRRHYGTTGSSDG